MSPVAALSSGRAVDFTGGFIARITDGYNVAMDSVRLTTRDYESLL